MVLSPVVSYSLYKTSFNVFIFELKGFEGRLEELFLLNIESGHPPNTCPVEEELDFSPFKKLKVYLEHRILDTYKEHKR